MWQGLAILLHATSCAWSIAADGGPAAPPTKTPGPANLEGHVLKPFHVDVARACDLVARDQLRLVDRSGRGACGPPYENSWASQPRRSRAQALPRRCGKGLRSCCTRPAALGRSQRTGGLRPPLRKLLGQPT